MKKKYVMYVLMVIGTLGFLQIAPGLYFGTIHDTVKANLFIGYGLGVYGICCGIPMLWEMKTNPHYSGWRLDLIKGYHKTEITLGIIMLIYAVFFL